MPARRLLLIPAMAAGLAACAADAGNREPLLKAAVSRFPACAEEISAFFTLNRVATQTGGDKQLYDPALEALRNQVTDCIDDNYAREGSVRKARMSRDASCSGLRSSACMDSGIRLNPSRPSR